MGFFIDRRFIYFFDKINIYWCSFWYYEVDSKGFFFQIYIKYIEDVKFVFLRLFFF